MKNTLLTLAFIIIWTGLLQAQGTFQNLDFESARIIFDDPPYYKSIATTNALPDWSAFSGTNQLTNIPYGSGGLISPVMLRSQTNGGSLSGNYSVFLGFNSASPQPGNTIGSISQTGRVPADALSLLFEVGTGFYDGPLTISLGGQDLSYIAISNASNYTLYGADISTFAGQTETLTFTAGVNGGLANAELDNIQFSQVAIPEPSAISLICLSSGVLFYVRKRKRF